MNCTCDGIRKLECGCCSQCIVLGGHACSRREGVPEDNKSPEVQNNEVINIVSDNNNNSEIKRDADNIVPSATDAKSKEVDKVASINELRSVVGEENVSERQAEKLLLATDYNVGIAINHYYTNLMNKGDDDMSTHSSDVEIVQNPFEVAENIASSSVKEAEVLCEMCSLYRPMSYVLCLRECKHYICGGCIRDSFLTMLGKKAITMACCVDECYGKFSIQDVRPYITEAQETAFYHLSLNSFVQNLVHCPQCSTTLGEKPTVDDIPHEITETDDKGEQLTRRAWAHYSTNRIRCGACGTNFCAECNLVPYHKGLICSEYAMSLLVPRCRFCGDEVAEGSNVCGGDDCATHYENVCKFTHKCQHLCNGIADERQHLRCLKKECAVNQSVQTGDEFCTICYVEDLTAAPCIELACGHVFHLHCVDAKLDKRWPGTRISFGFLECPICKAVMEHPAIHAKVQAFLELKLNIEHLALKRLQILRMRNHAKIKTVGSPFYEKPLAFGMASFAYYECHKCKEVYYGGLRNCEQNAFEDRPPEEFVCFNCVDDFGGEACKKKTHRQYHVWKCRFCCSEACWFCFGTTHFCDPCHRLAGTIQRRTEDSFQQCADRESCPLHVDHPPNGTKAQSEMMLRCMLCYDNNASAAAERRKREQEAKQEAERIGAEAAANAANALARQRRKVQQQSLARRTAAANAEKQRARARGQHPPSPPPKKQKIHIELD